MILHPGGDSQRSARIDGGDRGPDRHAPPVSCVFGFSSKDSSTSIE